MFALHTCSGAKCTYEVFPAQRRYVTLFYLAFMNTDPSTNPFYFLREQRDSVYTTVINRNAIQHGL